MYYYSSALKNRENHNYIAYLIPETTGRRSVLLHRQPENGPTGPVSTAQKQKNPGSKGPFGQRAFSQRHRVLVGGRVGVHPDAVAESHREMPLVSVAEG